MNGDSASRTEPAPRRKRLALDLLLLALIGLLMTVLGPYRTLDVPTPLRAGYWELAIVAGGLVGIAVDSALGPYIREFWTRMAAASLAMTPPVTLLVYQLNALILGLPRRISMLPQLAGQVLAVGFLIMAVRSLVWRRVVETHTLVVPPLPEADRTLRLRLSARLRAARLIALEAEDHYVRVHTDAGSELVSVRFSDAVDELARVHGFRLHRSWWAAAEAIEAIRWTRGRGEVRLSGGIIAPVSRSYATTLKRAGWR